MTRKRTIDAASARRLAVKAVCDPRTIMRVLQGMSVRGDAGNRARAVLVEAGYLRAEAEARAA